MTKVRKLNDIILNIRIPSVTKFSELAQKSAWLFRQVQNTNKKKTEKMINTNIEAFINRKELARMTGYSVAAIRTWHQGEKPVPCIQRVKGGKVLYLFSEVMQWLRDTNRTK